MFFVAKSRDDRYCVPKISLRLSMDIVFSGVQPTGKLHLGNYLGALKNWVGMQHANKCIFCIVDMHAITVPYNAKQLLNNVYNTLATYIACGIDVEKSIVFRQSDVKEHTELSWLLSCLAQYGKLDRMTQFKEKSGTNKEKSSVGLYTYPVLMAADILLYNAKYVPVGNDQLQHLELTREIADTFNHLYGVKYFTRPEPLLNTHGARIMSLRDGRKKMSKSDPSDYTRINLTDSSEAIVEKMTKATTDSYGFVDYDEENRPEISNLLRIYATIYNLSIPDAVNRFTGVSYGQFKAALSRAVVELVEPIASKISELTQDRQYLHELLSCNAEKARIIASYNMKKIKEIMGIY